ALLFGAIARGTTTITGFQGGRDNRATLAACRALGVAIAERGETLTISGSGFGGLRAAAGDIDCENSGTTMRLLTGVLAGRPFTSRLTGDASLLRRPMRRVIEPLSRMGAVITSEPGDGRAPLRIEGRALHAADHTLAVASAQVKSAILLAGLRARGRTMVTEPLPTRDHTERMLRHMGVEVASEGRQVSVGGGAPLRPLTIAVPGDPSSAAFFLVAALLTPGSELRVRHVGTNPLRIGAVEILRRMGARIDLDRAGQEAGEPHADLVVRAAELHGTTIAAHEVPGAIDELPILAVAGAFADGETRVEGAAELRVKESDRIGALEQLRSLGISIETRPDGFTVQGDPRRTLGGGSIVTHGDHRIAMAFAIAGLRSRDGIVIDDPDCAGVSFPGFFDQLTALGGVVEGA
ncbi:MAG TPA: 3-phosphoshikimate 1-carboxyvinyltransferase, partial [Candidatus Eisenbacteria bacterium]|nr:3-phosphoshikimate 1-carboxyvinyltransferase [Candidatus Eisenbacteria bacterium]